MTLVDVADVLAGACPIDIVDYIDRETGRRVMTLIRELGRVLW